MINKKDIRKTKKVYFEWTDAFSERGWTRLDNLSGPSEYLCCSVGYLIGENKVSYIIASTVSVQDSCIDPLHIPKKWVTKKKFL
jgi:hypothetical protein